MRARLVFLTAVATVALGAGAAPAPAQEPGGDEPVAQVVDEAEAVHPELFAALRQAIGEVLDEVDDAERDAIDIVCYVVFGPEGSYHC